MGDAQPLGIYTWQEWFRQYPIVEQLLAEGIKKTDIFAVRKAFSQAAAADDGEDVIEDVVPLGDMNDTAIKAAAEVFIETGNAVNNATGTGMQSACVLYVNDQGKLALKKDIVPTGITGVSTGITDAFFVNALAAQKVGTGLQIHTSAILQDDIGGTNEWLTCLTATNGGIIDGTLRFYCGTACEASIVEMHFYPNARSSAAAEDVVVRNQWTDLGPVSTARATMKNHQVPIFFTTANSITVFFDHAGHGIPIPPNTLWEMTVQNLTNAEDGYVSGDLTIICWNKNPRVFA
jgi:hypothetical protein